MSILLAQLMTSVTVHCRASRLVTAHAVFHCRGNFFNDDFMLCHSSMALGALYARLAMPRVAEEHKIFDCVDLLGWKRRGFVPQRCQSLDLRAVLLHRAVACHAPTHRRIRCLLPGVHRDVAIPAFDLQRRVLLVAEVDRLCGVGRPGYGKENATSESE